MTMETLALRLSDSSHASSPPSGSKSASNCRLIPLLSTPASVHGHSLTDAAPSPAAVVQNTSKNHEQSDLSCVLKGVVAYVDVRTECDNRSRAVESVLRQLGAEVSSKISKDVTHVIFKDGKKRTRDVALRRKLHFVTVLWLGKCKDLRTHVSEKDYPVPPSSHTPLPYGRYKRYRSMQPKSIEEDHADSAKKVQRRLARANKQRQLQTPSPQQWTFCPSAFFGADTQPRIDSAFDDDSNESSSSLTVPDTPPSLRKRLLSKQLPVVTDSATVTDTSGDLLQRKLFSIADSPCDDDEPRSKFDGADDAPVMSRLSLETSATGEIRCGTLASSEVSLRPLAVAALHQSNFHLVQTTASGRASSESVVQLTADCAAITLDSSMSLVRTDAHGEAVYRPVIAQPDGARTTSNTSLLRNEAAPTFSGPDRSICTDRRSSASPEIDVLPVVKRVTTASECNSAASSTGVAGTHSYQSPRSGVRGDDGMNTDGVTRSSVYRCGSPGLDEDGEFSCRKPKPGPAAAAQSQSKTAGSVKLIPLSRVLSTSGSSDSAAKHLSAKISHMDNVSTETADNKLRSSPVLHRQTERAHAPKTGRRQSTRLRAPKGILGRAKEGAADETKAVKFAVSSDKAEPTDKENVCVQRTTVNPAVSCQQPSQPENKETVHTSAKSRTSSRNSSLSGEDSDVSAAKRPRPFVKRARQDIESAHEQRLPTAWERHSTSSQVTTRRMSDRIKLKESDSDVQLSECQKSPPAVTDRKRSASSSSSGLSSCEKKSGKNVTRTIAMTSLHSDEQAKVRSVVVKLGRDFVISDSVVDSTTHVVCGGNRRTMKLLMGIARGCWIVSLDWVIKSEAAGRWLSEEKFEQHRVFPVARISRLEKNDEGVSYRQRLFVLVGSVYVDEDTVPPRRDLMELITLCGGQVTACLRKAQVCVGQRNKKNILTVSEQWVLDSITQHKCLPFDGYRVAG